MISIIGTTKDTAFHSQIKRRLFHYTKTVNIHLTEYFADFSVMQFTIIETNNAAIRILITFSFYIT